MAANNLIKLFDIQNGVIVPTEHCYTLKDLRFLMDNYPEETYLKMYQYLFYMFCYDPDRNPFFNAKETEREELILAQLDPDFSTEDEGMKEAIALAKYMYTTPTLRAFIGIKTALDNIADYMSLTAVTAGRDGNFGSMISAAEKFNKIRESYKGTEKDLISEQSSRVRGGGDLAYDEDDDD